VSLSEVSKQLDSALQQLRQNWDAAAAQWDDSVRREFEHTYWEPLTAQTLSMHRQMARLAEVIAQARRQLDDR
jgi:hypothetical protein